MKQSATCEYRSMISSDSCVSFVRKWERVELEGGGTEHTLEVANGASLSGGDESARVLSSDMGVLLHGCAALLDPRLKTAERACELQKRMDEIQQLRGNGEVVKLVALNGQCVGQAESIMPTESGPIAATIRPAQLVIAEYHTLPR